MPTQCPAVLRAIEAQTQAMAAQLAVEKMRAMGAESAARAMARIAEDRRERAARARAAIGPNPAG